MKKDIILLGVMALSSLVLAKNEIQTEIGNSFRGVTSMELFQETKQEKIDWSRFKDTRTDEQRMRDSESTRER